LLFRHLDRQWPKLPPLLATFGLSRHGVTPLVLAIGATRTTPMPSPRRPVIGSWAAWRLQLKLSKN